MITAEQVRELLDYDPETGKLFWVKPPKNHAHRVGQECGYEFRCAAGLVYRRMCLFGQGHLVHRLVWLLHHGHWPDQDIDHINGDGLDNRIENLRVVGHAINAKNRKIYKNNSTGVPGVFPVGNRWRVLVRSGGKLNHVGYFDSFEDAVQARLKASRRFGFHGNHGRAA